MARSLNASSGPNLLYRMMTGKRLTEDPCSLEGLDRFVGKQVMKFLINTEGFQGVELTRCPRSYPLGKSCSSFRQFFGRSGSARKSSERGTFAVL